MQCQKTASGTILAQSNKAPKLGALSMNLGDSELPWSAKQKPAASN
jgi:hypothetical protein